MRVDLEWIFTLDAYFISANVLIEINTFLF